jgi:hypothetical protein
MEKIHEISKSSEIRSLRYNHHSDLMMRMSQQPNKTTIINHFYSDDDKKIRSNLKEPRQSYTIESKFSGNYNRI